MRIDVKNISSEFHPDLIWKDGALGFFWRGRSNKKKNNNKMSSDSRSVPDLRTDLTRQLSYRKDDHAMRLIHGCPENFRDSLSMPRATYPEIFNGHLWMCVQNLNFVALLVPEIIWGIQKIWYTFWRSLPHPYSTLILGSSRCARSPILGSIWAGTLSYSAVNLFSKYSIPISNLCEKHTSTSKMDRQTT